MNRSTQELKDSGIEQRALKTGDTVPDFELPNQHGQRRRLSELLQRAPVVLNVYRGGWCPYCNMEMKALHDALPAIEAHGAQLVGLTPEQPDMALASAERSGLAIDILSDAGNRVSERQRRLHPAPGARRHRDAAGELAAVTPVTSSGRRPGRGPQRPSAAPNTLPSSLLPVPSGSARIARSCSPMAW